MDEEKSTDESQRMSMEPPPAAAASVDEKEKMICAEEKVEIDASLANSETVLPRDAADDCSKSSSPPPPAPPVPMSEAPAENSKIVENDENKQSPSIDATRKSPSDEDDPPDKPHETQNENENNNKNENDKINITSDETINKTVVNSGDETAKETHSNQPSNTASATESSVVIDSSSTTTAAPLRTSTVVASNSKDDDDDVKLEIDSSSLLDRVILYSLKNTVVDNSRLDAVKNRYLSSASSTTSANSNNKSDSHQTSSSNSNKGSDNSSIQPPQSNACKSVNEVIEEFKNKAAATSSAGGGEWATSSNNRTQFTSDKSDRHVEPSTKGAEKVYIINDSNSSETRETMSRECDKNVIFIPKGAERSCSYKRDFISENPPLASPHFTSRSTSSPPPHVKRVELEQQQQHHYPAYKFNFPAQRHLNTYDNSYHTNTTSSRERAVVNENSFLKRDLLLQQQYRDEEKTVIKQSRAPCMRLPDFSKQNFDTSSSTSVKNRAAAMPFESSNSATAAIEAQKTSTRSTPPLTSLKMQPPDFAEVIRRNNYISDLQLKPMSESTAAAAKYSYSHTPPPLHYNDSNYSPSPYHYSNHHSRSQQHIAPSSLSKMPTVIAHKTPTSSYERESEPMAHIISKNHHLIALKGEPSSQQQQQHNLMRANESGMNSIYSSPLPQHHQTLPPPLQPQQQSNYHHHPHVLNSHHNQSVSVIRDSTLTQKQQQLEKERRARINKYASELLIHPAEPPAHIYHGSNHHHHTSHSFSLKQKEDQLRQEGTIITLKTELNIVQNYDDRRSSTEVIREIHQSKPHESLDIRRTTYHISQYQGYHPHHGQESNYKHDNDPRANMLASSHPISTPPYYNNNATSSSPSTLVSNERYPAATTVNPLRSSMNRYGNSNSDLQHYEKHLQRSKTMTSDEYQQQQHHQMMREFAQPHPPSESSHTNFRFASQIPPPQHHPTTDYRTLPESLQIPYPRPPPVMPVYPPRTPPPPPPSVESKRKSSVVLRANNEVKFVPESAATMPSVDPLPSTSATTTSAIASTVVIKKESPLDLSVKTVKTKADSTGCSSDQDKKMTEPKSLKIEFQPDFSRAATTTVPVNFSMKKSHFPPGLAPYERPQQDLPRPIVSNVEPVNGQPPYFPPTPSSSSQQQRPPLTFKEEMFSKTPTPYRKPFGRISLEEERKLDRMYVEQMLHGKSPASREPAPLPLKHRYSQQQKFSLQAASAEPPKPFAEPLRDKIVAPKPQVNIHHYQSALMPTKEIIERQFVNSETRLEPIPPPPMIPYHHNITVKTENEEFLPNATSVITKQSSATITTTATASPTTSQQHESVHRGAEESTILKLKSNLEQKKIMLSRNEVSEYQEQMQTATTTSTMLSANESSSSNNAAVVSPRQFRTKGELKGFVQPNESINLLDWGNACHGFMQQLEVGGTTSAASASLKKKRPLKQSKASSSDDEDKPLVKLVKKEDDVNLAMTTTKASLSTVITSEEASLRQIREHKRIELEKKMAARLGHPSSSESETELKKKSSLRAKRRIRKLRKRETLGMKKTDGEQTCEEIESDVAIAAAGNKPTKLDNLTSSDEDEPNSSAPVDNSKRKKECQERRSSRSSASGKRKESIEKRNSSSPTKNKSAEPSKPTTANDLKQLGISSPLDNLINEAETMTRSKRKLEIEKKLSNSKVLRNDKVVRNDLCVKKMRNVSVAASTTASSVASKVAAKKSGDSPKRKLDDADSKEVVDKKKAKKSVIASSDDSSDSEMQKSDTEKKSDVEGNSSASKKIQKNAGENSNEKSTKSPKNSTPKSSFEPGWETETYKFKKSLKIPAGLITIAGKSSSASAARSVQSAKSLTDLDNQLSDDASETFSQTSKKTKKSGESKTKGQDKSDKRNSSSIIDLLHQRFVQLPRRIRSRKSGTKNGDSSLVDDFGLLPTPEKESDKVFGFKKNIFEPSIITSRTRNENSSKQKKEILREVFGADDERPKSAPPGGNVDEQLVKEKVEEKISYDQKYREYLLQMDVDFAVKKTAAKSSTPNDESKLAEDIKDESEEEAATPSLLTVPKKKSRTRRLKGSSGFDYIRKKKKTTTTNTETQLSLSNNIIKKRLQARENLETKDEGDIAKEIKGWVLNKGVGESVLHKASRLNYMDVIAFCLERLNMNPDMKDNAGYTPLHEACSRGHLEVAQILLLYGANHSETALSGIRPLHEAIENGHVEIVRLLISYGADPCLATYSGQLPITMADDDEMKYFLTEYMKDLDLKNGNPVPWEMQGPYQIDNNSFDNICNVLHDPPCSIHEVESSIASVYSTSLTSLVTATTQLSDAETVMTESTASLIKESIQDVMKYPHRMIKNDSNSNNLIMTDLSKQKSRSTSLNSNKHGTKRASKKKSVLNNNNSSTAGNIASTLKTKEAQKMSSTIKTSEDFKSTADDKFDCIEHDSDNDIFELEESDVPLPPVYLLKDEGTDKWILLTDLCSLLKVKSKEAVLKQISPLSPSSASKELIRELKMTDFLQKATCLQLFCAGEKINVRASKIALIRYNESVKNLLGVETIRMNM